MYKMSTITIWCLVRGSSSAFYVTIDRNNFIIDFKGAIKNKNPNVFANVDAAQLVLWKLKTPADDSHISDIQNYTLQDGVDENENVTLMKDMRKIVTYWPKGQAPTNDLIHVIVVAPEQPGVSEQPVPGDVSNLKREFQSVIREELSSVKEELSTVKEGLKRVRLNSETMWFSAPATFTETEKGIFVRKHCQDISFPFTLTKTTQRRILGKFRSPPNANAPEKELQEFFMRECTALGSLDSTKLIVHDTHITPLLDTRKPDFVFIPKGWPLDSLNVVVVGEIRTQSSNGFSNADVGHAISFGEKVLQIQPRRSFIYVLLTDCMDICMFKVTRANDAKSGNVRFSYERISLQTLTFNTTSDPPTGWQHLVTIMECTCSNLGWVDPSLNFGTDTVNLIRSINTGRTSIVYEGVDNNKNRVVAKIAKEYKYLSCFATEKNVLKELITINSPHLQKLLLDSENILITTPICSKVNHLQKKDIGDIIKTLKMVHSTYNRIHMDLRKYNFLRDDNGHIVIIDWGYSVKNNEIGSFAGALEVMPDDILESLINGEQIKYSPRIDLICFVRTFYLMFHKPTNADIKRISFNGAVDTKSKAQKLLNFWSNHGKSYLWKNFYQQAYDLKYEDLIEGLEALF